MSLYDECEGIISRELIDKYRRKGLSYMHIMGAKDIISRIEGNIFEDIMDDVMVVEFEKQHHINCSFPVGFQTRNGKGATIKRLIYDALNYATNNYRKSSRNGNAA